MRAASAAIIFAAFLGGSVAASNDAAAQPQPRQATRVVVQAQQAIVPLRRRPRVRIYRNYYAPDVYPRYNPGPNAVRDCTATYVQEFRPSGTVITPRMSCFWRQP